jgi:hypothetical protein
MLAKQVLSFLSHTSSLCRYSLAMLVLSNELLIPAHFPIGVSALEVELLLQLLVMMPQVCGVLGMFSCWSTVSFRYNESYNLSHFQNFISVILCR